MNSPEPACGDALQHTDAQGRTAGAPSFVTASNLMFPGKRVHRVKAASRCTHSVKVDIGTHLLYTNRQRHACNLYTALMPSADGLQRDLCTSYRVYKALRVHTAYRG